MPEDDHTHPVINVEESIGKTVGYRTKAPRGLSPERSSVAASEALRREFGGLGVPRGVFRFKSHEEADEWMIKHLARASARKEAS